jgi:hypothetical protein
MNKLCVAIVLIGTFSILAIGQKTSSAAPPRPGGRPGRFMFATDEEIVADTAQRKEVREVLASIRTNAAQFAKNKAARQQLLGNVALLEKFVNTVEERQTHTSSSTSGVVLAMLNEKKGVGDCAFCHTEDDPHEPVRSRKGK